MAEIIPAILPSSVEDLLQKVAALPREVSLFHFDVLEEDIWAPVNKDFEAHLMVEEPEKIIGKWAERGAKRIIMHSLTAVGPLYSGPTAVVKLGLGVELDVPLEVVYPFVDQVDFIHLMSIAEVGEQGHPLDVRIFDRIKSVREKFPQLIISIDGGVNIDNFKKLKELGANRLIAGSGFKELWSLQTREQ